jgi:AcrR family transcriptional regulator
MPAASLSGRRAQAARNDELIMNAAREVFVADPTAPIAAVAERAGVGISALYRRYGSKEDMLRRLCADGLETYIRISEKAPWETFVAFARSVVSADTHAMTISLAGTFTTTPELMELAQRCDERVRAVIEQAHASGVLRADVTHTDFGLLFEQLSSVRRGSPERTAELRERYLALLLDSLHTPPRHEPLPGPPPRPGEFADRWEKRS